jgi:GAF domain-containing protein
MTEPTTEASDKELDDLEQRLANLRDRNARLTAERRKVDLRAIVPLIEQYGPDNVRTVEVGYISPDFPVLCLVRANDKAEFKRYRAALERSPDGTIRDAQVATDQLGRACTLYPDGETLSKLCDHKATLSAQLGKEALSISRGVAESEKKG